MEFLECCIENPVPYSSSSTVTNYHIPQFSKSTKMPMTIIRSSRPENGQTQKKGPTFTGEVWYDSVLNKQEEGITMVTATFTPCARTHWHHHEDGQVLEVKAGSGWVCDKGGVPQKLAVGDIVWCPAGTVHWHGADDGSILVHLAISRGKTTWYDAVTEEEYNARLGNAGK